MANKYLRKHLVPDAATETDLYTVPDVNTSVLRSLRVTNNNSTATQITVSQYDSGGTEVYLLKDFTISPSGTTDVFNGVPCVLTDNDKITVESSLASVHFYLSYLEMDRT